MSEMYPRCPVNLRNAIRELHRAGHREDVRQFIIEGPHACGDLQAAGIRPIAVIIRDDATLESLAIARAFLAQGADVFASGSKDMGLMADAAAPQDIIVLARFFEERPLGTRIVLLDAVSDPGNVGSIIRSAAWFGCTDVILGVGCADMYNPKVVRSAAGALARMNILRKKDLTTVVSSLGGRPIIAAVAKDGLLPSGLRELSSFALLIGSEAQGLATELLEVSTMRVTIPGGNGTESLNAAIAASILLYEVSRA
ncbi:MAG: RNA methyltransferase [Candidatus Kapabacteria bacterium]|nr:RNA methyltransferase [Candidatus Kapabacteria bacterium]